MDDQGLLVACDRFFDVGLERSVDVFAAFVFWPEVARDRFFFDLFDQTRFAVGEDRERDRDDFRTRLRALGDRLKFVCRRDRALDEWRETLGADASDFGGEDIAFREALVRVIDVVCVPR